MSPKIVLNEDEYMERLGSILKRDFFPSLQVLESELSHQERLSLAQFQARYTTEDNASFEELLSRENEKKRAKFERVHGGPAVLVDDPSRRLLLKPSESVLKLESSSSNRTPSINLHNTRFKKPQAPTFSSGKTVEKFTPIPMMPQFVPGADATPLFTFGDVDSTPQVLSRGNETPSIAFRIPPTPVREQIAHSLAQKKAAKNRSTPRKTTAKYNLADLKGLTPTRKPPKSK